MPYRPRSFLPGASLEFEADVDFVPGRYEFWVDQNESIGNRSDFDGYYWADHLQLWVVDSVANESWLFDDLLMQIARQVLDRVEDEDAFSQADSVNLMLAFVHQFRYASDASSTGISEYARFPIETLRDKKGDCECLALLLAALIHRMELAEVAMLRVEKRHVFSRDSRHAAVGVIDDDGSISGTYIRHGGQRYYYCEATGSSRCVGSMPDEYDGGDFWVYPV